MIFIELLHIANKIDNYDADATGGGLWISTTQFKATCPSAKRWFLLGGIVYRDNNSSLVGTIRNAAGQALYWLTNKSAAAATWSTYPDVANTVSMHILDGGDYVDLVFGAAQGAAAAASCVVLEYDV